MENVIFLGKVFNSEKERNKYIFENRYYLRDRLIMERASYLSWGIAGGFCIGVVGGIIISSWIVFFVCSIIFPFLLVNSKNKEIEQIDESLKEHKKILDNQKKAKQRREKKEKLANEKFAVSQREKGLELFEGKWVDKKEIPKLKEIQIGLDKNFQNLSSYEFEKFIAKLFKAMGYETRVTQASNDYGIDVVAEKGNEKIAIQCKRYRPGNPISNRDIQRLLGAMQLKSVRANHSIVITTSHFTIQAKEQAKECAIELWDRHDLEKMVRKYLMKI